ncbi:hypothetical protein OG266_07845 [Streptomyces sp. NBC_00554]|uniref:hypothetical protein n=1 Tax=unclassified Streptomyces TaxID=2593676 RepID=UPI002259E1A9|nr:MULTISPECIES: hypothetical protein [unclassified Streptomyces]MCX4978542.1 hypothetical protein [Streptomyces sp. NBC_00620]WUC48351.1 hypothetical protein OG266_07845 [Streptomyces sp. NBC_00554]
MITDAYGIAVTHEVTVPDHQQEAAASPYTAERPVDAPGAQCRRVRAARLLGGGFMT